MKSKLLLSFAAALLMLSACGVFKSYVASYSVGLESVESPANSKQRFGGTKIVTLKDNGVSKYRYEDDFIDITWLVDNKKFHFILRNKSEHTILINWDEISYVDIAGRAGRVMHSGVKYTERYNSLPPTTIPNGATLTDLLLPVDNVYYVEPTKTNPGGWRERYLIYYSSRDKEKMNPQIYVGRKMSIMMPIIIEGIQNEYTFKFNVEDVLGIKKVSPLAPL